MTPGRIATLLVMVLIPTLMWSFSNRLRNDLLTRTRILIKRAKAEDEAARPRFRDRYRLPGETVDQQNATLDRLWGTVRSIDPRTVSYGDVGRRTATNGRALPYQQVLIDGQDLDRQPVQLRLEWVRQDGGWYIDEFSSVP